MQEFADTGAIAIMNWWKTSLDHIPKALRDQGVDQWNLDEKFFIPFVSATSSEVGQLMFNGKMEYMPPENLLRAYQVREDIKAGRQWTYINNMDIDFFEPRPPTCFATTEDANGELRLKFNQPEFVFKVIFYPEPQGWQESEHFWGLDVWADWNHCGTILKLDQPKDKHQPHWLFCKNNQRFKSKELIFKWNKDIRKAKTPKRIVLCSVHAVKLNDYSKSLFQNKPK